MLKVFGLMSLGVGLFFIVFAMLQREQMGEMVAGQAVLVGAGTFIVGILFLILHFFKSKSAKRKEI